MTEADVQKAIMDYCRIVLRAVVLRNNAGAAMVRGKGGRMRPMRFGAVGTPDLTVLMAGGRTLWIEVKRPGGKVRPAQAEWIAEAERMGHWAIVASDIDDIRIFLSEKGYREGARSVAAQAAEAT